LPQLVGRPGRAAALARFSITSRRTERVWIARRIDIARALDHEPHPYKA